MRFSCLSNIIFDFYYEWIHTG